MNIFIDFATAIAAFLSFVLILVMVQWFMYTQERRDEDCFKKSEDMIQCPFCNFIFYNFEGKEIKKCPRCKSYVEEKLKKQKID